MQQEVNHSELRVIVSETRTGRVVKQKLGSNLLWKKEFHEKYNFFVLDIKQFICRSCNYLNKLEEPKRCYVEFNDSSIHSLVCKLCGNNSEFIYREKSLVPESIVLELTNKSKSSGIRNNGRAA